MKGWGSVSTDKVIENAVASVKMEGYQVDNECIQLCKKLLENEISMEHYIALVKQKTGVAVWNIVCKAIRGCTFFGTNN